MSNTQVQSTVAIDLAQARTFASGVVAAAVKAEGAQGAFMATVAKLAAKVTEGRNAGLTGADYSKAIGPLVKAAFDRQVKAGKLSESTVPGYCSRIKMAVLAVANKVGTPNKGEAIKAFNDRMAEALAKAKTPTGADVLPVTKVGAPKGKPKATMGSKAKGGKSSLKPASGTEPATNASTFMAAALILTGKNKARAEKLVTIFSKGQFVAEFDKWAKTILA